MWQDLLGAVCDFGIEHKQGRKHSNADGMSRSSLHLVWTVCTFSFFAGHRRRFPIGLSRIVRMHRSRTTWWSKNPSDDATHLRFRKIAASYGVLSMSVINGILYRKIMLLGVNVVCWWFCASSKAPFFICWVTKAQPVILTILTLILVLAIVFLFWPEMYRAASWHVRFSTKHQCRDIPSLSPSGIFQRLPAPPANWSCRHRLISPHYILCYWKQIQDSDHWPRHPLCRTHGSSSRNRGSRRPIRSLQPYTSPCSLSYFDQRPWVLIPSESWQSSLACF